MKTNTIHTILLVLLIGFLCIVTNLDMDYKYKKIMSEITNNHKIVLSQIKKQINAQPEKIHSNYNSIKIRPEIYNIEVLDKNLLVDDVIFSIIYNNGFIFGELLKIEITFDDMTKLSTTFRDNSIIDFINQIIGRGDIKDGDKISICIYRVN